MLPLPWLESESDESLKNYFYASWKIQAFLGHRSPRDHWLSLDFKRRNFLPGESKFKSTLETDARLEKIKSALMATFAARDGDAYAPATHTIDETLVVKQGRPTSFSPFFSCVGRLVCKTTYFCKIKKTWVSRFAGGHGFPAFLILQKYVVFRSLYAYISIYIY
jgi:hypothetical protein